MCNVAHLAQYISPDIPSYKTKVSYKCGYSFDTQSVTISINVDLILCKGLSFMQEAIDDGHKTCRKCQAHIEDDIRTSLNSAHGYSNR